MLRWLSLPAVAPALERLVHPLHGDLLDGTAVLPTGVHVAALVALSGFLPVGVLVREYGSADEPAVIHSLAVARAFRRRGLGRRLLAGAEADARHHRLPGLVAFFPSDARGRPALEQLGTSLGWRPPARIGFRFTARADWYLRTDPVWARLRRSLHAQGYGQRPWGHLSRDERRAAVALQASAPPMLRFEDEEASADPALSVALMRHDHIVGWILGRSPGRDGRCVYPVGHVERALQHRGWLAAGMVDVCRRQAARYGSGSLASFDVAADNGPMAALLARRLARHGRLIERLRSERVFDAGQESGPAA